MIKKIFSAFFALIFVFACALPASGALYEPENPDAEVIYMICLDNGTVICDHNSDHRVAPASITKVVTAILTIENCTNYDQVITVPAYCIRALDGTNSSTAGILVGEEMSVRDLLYCLLVQSANDAANVLADFIGGGNIDTFIGMMNDFVAGLGCRNTHFANAHGLDDDTHYTTALDLSLIYQYCLKNSFFCELAGTFTYEIPPTNKYNYTRYLRNTNNLLNAGIRDYYSPYVKTGKTGTTDNAGRCVISSASNDGYNYLCMVLNAKFYDFDDDGVEENMAFVLSKQLYDWAFTNLRIREVANPSVYVGEVEVRLSREYDYVSMVPAETVTALVPSGVSTENVMYEPYAELTKTVVDAPVRQGDVLGKAAIKYGGQTIAEVDLVAAFSVQRSTVKYIGDRLLKLVGSRPFKWLMLAVFVVGLPLLAVIFIVVPAQRRKKKSAVRVVSVKKMDPKDRK